MAFITFLQSASGRVARTLFGLVLLYVGARTTSIAGLLLLMTGLIPIVTAVANVCLMADAYDLFARPKAVHGAPAERGR